MSTNSTIAIKRIDGTTTSIYCHYDGYFEGVGATLQLAYNTAEKVEELLKLRDLSVLGYFTEPQHGEKHDFEHPTQNVCVAYHRDRGEEFRQSSGRCEFNYVFDEADAVWYVEYEQFVKQTKATMLLGIDYFLKYKKELLLDALSRVDWAGWRDDEFTTACDVYENCVKKAQEAREEIRKQRAEEYEANYRAFCD